MTKQIFQNILSLIEASYYILGQFCVQIVINLRSGHPRSRDIQDAMVISVGVSKLSQDWVPGCPKNTKKYFFLQLIQY